MTAKLNMSDGVRGGIPIEESLQTAKWLEEDGGLDALELTAGSSLVNPMYLFRGDAPVKEFAGAFKPPLRWGIRMTGKKFFREYPYREAYLMRDAKQFRAELKMPLILLGGITNRETMDLAMAEGFDFVAMGRALLAEPDLINRIKADGARTPSVDLHALQQCMATIYSHTHCVVTGSPRRSARGDERAGAVRDDARRRPPGCAAAPRRWRRTIAYGTSISAALTSGRVVGTSASALRSLRCKRLRRLVIGSRATRPVERVGAGQQHLAPRSGCSRHHCTMSTRSGDAAMLGIAVDRSARRRSLVLETLLGAHPQLAAQRGARREAVVHRAARRAGGAGHRRHA